MNSGDNFLQIPLQAASARHSNQKFKSAKQFETQQAFQTAGAVLDQPMTFYATSQQRHEFGLRAKIGRTAALMETQSGLSLG
eukprot:s285_g14.t1